MTIHLPKDVERSINEAVLRGDFASMDEAMTKAAQLLLQGLRQDPKPASAGANSGPGSIGAMRDAADGLNSRLAATPTASQPGTDPILGLMRDDAELMDEIVADAYRQRREETWRELDL